MGIPQMTLPDFLGYGNEQRQIGEKRGLAQLMGQAMTAPREQRQGYVAKMAGTSPEFASSAQKQFDASDDSARERLAKHAAIIDALPDEMKAGEYAKWAPQAQAAGIPAPPDWNPAHAQNFKQMVMALNGGQAAAQPTSVQEYLYAQQNPGFTGFLAEKHAATRPPQYGNINGTPIQYGPDGYRPVPAAGQPPQAAQPPQDAPQGADVMGAAYRGAMAPAGVQGLVKSLAGQFGGQVSSLQRSPAHNAKVGGVANSQHLTGTAGDVVVPPQNKAAFIAAAKAQGLEAIDEGDHIHLELPPQGRAAPAQSAQASIYTQAQPPITAPAEVKQVWPFLNPQQRQQVLEKTAGLNETKPQMLTDAEVQAEGLPKGTKAYRDADGIIKTTYTPSAAAQAGGKPLPGNVVTKLTKQAEINDNTAALLGSFSDGYAGNKIGGKAENLLGQLGGEKVGLATPGQADWWQRYDRQKNTVRNELFGSALTPSEQAAFEAADIRPNMAPDKVRSNLRMQAALVAKGLARQAKVWKAQGYNTDAIDAATSPMDADAGGKQVKRTGTSNGRRVIEYTDGTIEYGN